MTLRRNFALAFAALLLIVLGCDSKTPQAIETEAERDRSIKKAFAEDSVAGAPLVTTSDGGTLTKTVVTEDSRYRPGADEMLGRLRLAFSQENVSELAQLIDGDTMVREAIEMGALPASVVRGDRGRAFVRGFEQGMSQALAATGSLMKWDETRITRIEATDVDRMIVYVKLWDEEMEAYSKLRWWLKKSGSEWKVYDFEDFDMNVRMSMMIGVGFTASQSGENQIWAQSLLKILAFMQQQESAMTTLLTIDELDPVFETLISAEGVPPKIQGLAHFFKAAICIVDEDWKAALDQIEAAQQIDPGLPVHLYMKTTVFSQMGRYEEARKSLDAYAEKLGWDADTCMFAAQIAYDSGDSKTAREFALRGLEDQPGSFYNLEYYGLALPEAEKGKIEDYFLKLSDSESGFEYLMDAFLLQEDDAAMNALMAIQREHHPDSELIEYYEELISE